VWLKHEALSSNPVLSKKKEKQSMYCNTKYLEEELEINQTKYTQEFCAKKINEQSQRRPK
jgi:hypothetical protein